jgi:dipeptidyl aminopeptidase/acylaminoacyl peptidase
MPPEPLPLNRIYLAHTLAEPAFGASADEVFYGRTADGRNAIVRQSLDTGLAQVVTAEPAPSGGVGYGQGVFAVRGDLLVYAAKGGQLHGLNLVSGEQWLVASGFEGVANAAISPCGRYVAFIAEQAGRANVLLADVAGKQLPVKLSGDPWYALNAAFSPDGSRMAWMEWDEHEMPWTESRLVLATLARPAPQASLAGHLLPLEAQVLSRPQVSYASPQFSPDGRYLAYTSDETGWRSLWVADLQAADPWQAARRVDTGLGEIGGPDWVPNLIKMRWNDDGSAIFALRRHESRVTLVCIDWPAGTARPVACNWTDMRDLQVRGSRALFLGARPTHPQALVTLDLDSGREQVLATSAVGLLDAESLIEPRVISWPTVGGHTAWGILYQGRAPDGHAGRLPLIVSVHGGPTSEDLLSWDPQAQYFAARGWHYLLVNHRGGSGFGRAYQDMLTGQWGVVDIEDARSGAEHVIGLGLADEDRLVITGGSAGGYSTLMALTQQADFWRAGVAKYAVADLYELKQGSHRFEVNYELGLIGPLPATGRRWKERSPLTHARSVRAPVLLFHGRDDRAVPVRQSIDFAEAVRAAGGIAELVLYDGEGHGFRKESTRRDVVEKTERFLDKYVICLQC